MENNFPIKTATACALKWNWSTLFLNSGITRSCFRTSETILTPENFDNFHNTEIKIADRKAMLNGKWPNSSCGYCKNIEDSGGFSDRNLHLTLPHAVPPELKENKNATVVSPTILEVYFNNTCNMGCLYCGPNLSSAIAQENKAFGDFINNGVTLVSREKNYKTLVPYFWTWLYKNYETLRELHILGGEPLLQKELDTLLDFFENKPNPYLSISITTNLNISNEILKSFVEKTKNLVKKRKLKSLGIICSIDCWGKEQEYVRYGLNLDLWENNFEYLLRQKWISLKIHQTISLLTIKTMPKLIEKLIYWKSIGKVGQHFGEVNPSPTYLKPGILGAGVFSNDFENIISLMPSSNEEEKNAVMCMRGIADLVEKSVQDKKEISKLFTYLNEKDRRRGTSWRKLFPWLSKFEIDITNEI